MPRVFGLTEAAWCLGKPHTPWVLHCCLRRCASCPEMCICVFRIRWWKIQVLENLNSGGRRGAFPPSCSLLSAILPHGLYLSRPPSQRSQPLWMCCSAEQMKTSSASSCSTRNCCQTLGFLFQHCRNLGTVRGSGGCPAALGKGEGDSCHLLTGLAALLVCERFCLSFFWQWCVLLVQPPGQERLQSCCYRVKLTCRCWHFSLSSVFKIHPGEKGE